MTTVGINAFVRRQTKQSPFSYTDHSEDELIALVQSNWQSCKPGNRDGVVLVPVTPEKFYTGVVLIQADTPLHARLIQRREGEEPYVQVTAEGPKLPARQVDVVCYRRDALGGDCSTDREWEIVSINARPTDGEEPPTPLTMARNFLALPGGTPTQYSSEEFARAIIYWSKRALAHEGKKP